MAHLAMQSTYTRLVDRINKFPAGAPPSDLLFAILKLLYTEEEAGLVALLPIKPFKAEVAAKIWKEDEATSRQLLDNLADPGLLLDPTREGGRPVDVKPPPMAGFFEFSMMRVRSDLDQKALSELFHQYISVEEDFMKSLFVGGDTPLGRMLVHEGALGPELQLQVLDHERASEVIKTASHIGVGLCYCRHKAEHLGKACGAPQNICMTLGTSARSLIKHGIARQIETGEALEMLEQAREAGLVQFAENVQKHVNFICNCCGCCCEAMHAARRFGMLHPIQTTDYLPEIDVPTCIGCDKCTNACPVAAMGLVSANDPRRPRTKKARVDTMTCLGCGVCVRSCPKACIKLMPRPERVITPPDSVTRVVIQAIERGKLQNLIFDQQALLSHRAMAAILGVILKLPPVKRALASRQLNSRYLDRQIARNPLISEPR